MNKKKQKAIIVDIDGTLALLGDRSPYDTKHVGLYPPNQPIIDLVKLLQFSIQNAATFIITGREKLEFENWNVASVEKQTRYWLWTHNIRFNHLYMRELGDHRKDFVIKKEIYDQKIKQNYNVLYVIEDRRQVIDMWRSEGLTVLDVAGNDF